MKIYLHGAEHWPVWNPYKADNGLGTVPADVSEETFNDWKTAMKEYTRVQREMGEVARKFYDAQEDQA